MDLYQNGPITAVAYVNYISHSKVAFAKAKEKVMYLSR